MPAELSIELGYQKLAPRNLLSATFSLLGVQLLLNDFDAGQDLSISQAATTINGSNMDAYLFELSSGSWTGFSLDPNIEIESVNGGINNQLQIATNVFGGELSSRIAIDGITGTPLNIHVSQLSPSFVTNELQLSNITAVDSSLDFDIQGRVVLDNLAIVDSNPNDAVTGPHSINVRGQMGIEVAGSVYNQVDNVGAGIFLTADGDQRDVQLEGRLTTMAGSVRIFADDSIVLGTDSRIVAGKTGDVFLTAGQDSFSRIEFSAGAAIDAVSGRVTIDIANGSDIQLGNITSAYAGDAITLIAGGHILDFTDDERANLSAINGTVSLTAGGSLGRFDFRDADLNIEANRLLVKSGSFVNLDSSINQIDITVAGNLIVDNIGDLNFTDLDGDGAALVSSGANANLLVTAGSRIQISDDILAVNANRMSMRAIDGIESAAYARILLDSGHAQFNAGNHVFIGNQANDEAYLRSVGIVTRNAHLEIESGILINGTTPNLDPNEFGKNISFGTRVDETLYVVSGGEIRQTAGNLYARQLGLIADGHVHLSSIDWINESLAITASGFALLTDATMGSQLDALSKIEASDVDAGAAQSIAFLHRGTATIGIVESPTGVGELSGLNSFSQSIFVSAADGVKINADITAVSVIVDPQVTVYVANGTAVDPKIEFNDAAIRVGGPQNLGIVNSPFTTATFFDSEGFVFRGTTEFLVLSTDGTVRQDIVVEYGHPGEAGYRIGVFWDNGIRTNNRTGQPLETFNTYIPNVNDRTEAFNDPLYQNNPSTLHSINGEEGIERGTVSKVGPYSKSNVIRHQDEFKVFSLVTVRNDQNINLFAGSLNTANNSLNETEQIIRADYDSPKKFAIQLPPISTINPLEIRTVVDRPASSATPQDITTSSFQRDVAPFETGELKWVRVKIPLNDLTEVGDEVRLKDATKVYGSLDDATAVPLNALTGENQIEAIIAEIERHRDAEPGYWYKVFKDYKNRNDELFFYHLKTGEVPQVDLGPENNFDPDAATDASPSRDEDNDDHDSSSHNEGTTETSPRHDDTKESDNELNPAGTPHPVTVDSVELTLSRNMSIENQASVNRDDGSGAVNLDSLVSDSLSTTSTNLGLTAGTLLMAGLIQQRQKSAEQIQYNEPVPDKSEPPPAKQMPGFLRLDRLKRKLDQALSRTHNGES